jgi:hypothetical protein
MRSLRRDDVHFEYSPSIYQRYTQKEKKRRRKNAKKEAEP